MSAHILDIVSRDPNQICFGNDHPLSRPLKALFQAENYETERIETDIRAAVLRISPAPIAAWLTHDEDDDKADKLTWESWRSLRSWSRVSPCSVNARPLLGTQPLSFLSARSTPGGAVSSDNPNNLHSLRDREALELAKLIATKITSNPLTLSNAMEFISRRMENASTGEAEALAEWKELIQTMSVQQLARFLTDSGERATRLRQSLPFMGLVSQEERAAIRSRLRSS